MRKDDDDSTTKGSAAQHNGQIRLPEGEKAMTDDPGDRKEATATALANRGSAGPPFTTSPAPERGQGCGAADPLAGESWQIVRATTRYAVDLRRRKEDPDRDRCDHLHDELRSVRADLVRGANVAMRARWMAEAKLLDDYLLAHGGEPPRSEDWPSANLSDYATVRMIAPKVASGICGAVSRVVCQKWRSERWDTLIRQVRSPPHYRAGMPIPMRAAECKIVKDDTGFWLRLTLRAGERFALPLTPKDAWQREELTQLATGGWRLGEVKVQEDRIRARKWYIRVAYKRKVPVSQDIVEAGVNRGIRCFVTAAIGDGREPWIYDGADIVSFLAQTQRRRREYQRQVKASTRVGHGRRRVLRPVEHLSGKADRWRATRNQVIAARLTGWLLDRKVGRVYLEDFTGIRDGEPERLEGGERIWQTIQEWPYYQFESALRSALEAKGITVVTVSAKYISQTDPRDGSPATRDLGRWKLVAKDGKKWHLDVGAALNVLARGRAARQSAEALEAGKAADLEVKSEVTEHEGHGKPSVPRGARRTPRKSGKGKGPGGTGHRA